MRAIVISTILGLFLVTAPGLRAQENGMPANDSLMDFMFSSSDPEEQTIILPFGAKFEEGPPIDDVIEAVGRVTYATVPVYTKADKASRILRYATPDERVIIIAANDLWYFVRMYNGKEGFIERRNLKTVRVFYDETVTTNRMDRRLSVELKDLVDKLNLTFVGSVYAEKYQIIPRLTLISAARNYTRDKSGDTVVLTLEYCAVDKYGSIIPSRENNMLYEELQNFIELLFMKMLPVRATNYTVIIRKPVFGAGGRVLNTQGAYAEITLKHDDVDIKKIRDNSVTMLSLVKSSIPRDKLFLDFPN